MRPASKAEHPELWPCRSLVFPGSPCPGLVLLQQAPGPCWANVLLSHKQEGRFKGTEAGPRKRAQRGSRKLEAALCPLGPNAMFPHCGQDVLVAHEVNHGQLALIATNDALQEGFCFRLCVYLSNSYFCRPMNLYLCPRICLYCIISYKEFRSKKVQICFPASL